MKVGLFKTNTGDHLLIIIHHLVVDGVSWRILLEDFSIGYEQGIQKEKIEFQEKTHSFKKWASVLNEYADSKQCLKELAYWETLNNRQVISLPKKQTVPTNLWKDERYVETQLAVEETVHLLQDVNHAYRTEINDILLVSLGLALKEWGGSNEYLIHLEG
ncbi:condensation domain-containing protein, partial [Priestia aryabhattai]|uniref:condensation domain-containing protein n=1 Tax=Priestia aryabhattai TaxID=412384 RepID=UPI0027DF968C